MFDPQGPISSAERVIVLDSLAIMLVIVVPTIVATLAFAWWFRESNPRATYLPTWAYSGRLEFVVWAIPALIVIFLGGIAWIGSHKLDPYAPIESKTPTVEVQVVSLDWKWLFLYPAQEIASVNRLVIPAGAPVHFSLTSGTVMNSFFVPQLAGQIYTMAGMTSQLSFVADRPGAYPGLSAQFSGDGFSDMHFDVQAVSPAEFTAWVDKTKMAGGSLDQAAYSQLLKPAVERDAPTYGSVDRSLFDSILRQSVEVSGAHDDKQTAAPASTESEK